MDIDTSDRLPEQFRCAHELSFFLHDLLAQMVVSGEDSSIFSVTFTLNDDRKREELSRSDDPLAWLESNGYRHVAEEVCYRQTFLALLSDLCHFVYEALKCSSKEKLVVAFALLRKPLKDNLFYLEWMLVDRQGFVNALMDLGPEALRNKWTESLQLDLIRRVRQRLANTFSFDESLIRELRYRKDSAIGLDRFFTQAQHLVTVESAAIKTEPRNLNLIFKSPGVSDAQWSHLYGSLPYLLNYAVEVAEAITESFAPTEPEFLLRMRMRRNAGLLLWASDMPTIGSQVNFDSLLVESRSAFPTSCPTCKSAWSFDAATLKSAYREIYESESLTCPNCSADVFQA